jgi:hypothetical protein
MGWPHVNGVRDMPNPEDRPSGYWVVFYVLASYADPVTHTCYPSMSTIARGSKMSEKSSRRYVHQLQKDGHVDVIANAHGGRAGVTPIYKLKVINTPSIPGSPTPPRDVTYPSHRRATTPPSDGSQKNARIIYKEDKKEEIGRPPTPAEQQKLTQLKALFKSTVGIS